jgi:hypothetical protein
MSASSSPLSSLSDPEVAFLLKESQLLRDAVKAKNSERVADLLDKAIIVNPMRTAWLASKSELIRDVLEMTVDKGGPKGVLIIGPEFAEPGSSIYTFLKHYADNEPIGSYYAMTGGYDVDITIPIDMPHVFSMMSWRGVYEPRPMTATHVKDLIESGMLTESDVPHTTLPHGVSYGRPKKTKAKNPYTLKGLYTRKRRAPRVRLSPVDKRIKPVKPSHYRSGKNITRRSKD